MSKQEERFTIRAMPWSSGLTNQGGQATVPENALWEAKNADMDSTGRLFKRPGFRKWSYSLQRTPKTGYIYTEVFEDLGHFEYSTSGTATSVFSGREGSNLAFRTKQTGDGTFYHQYNRIGQVSDNPTGATPTANKCIVNMVIRTDTTLPAQSSTTSAANGFSLSIRSDHANVCTLLFLSTGIFYYNGTNYVISNTSTDIDDGRWHKVQVKITAATTATITIDDDTDNTVSITFTNSGLSVAANQVMLRAAANSNDTYAVSVNLLQYSDNNTLNAAKLKVIKSWDSVVPPAKHLLVAAEDVLWEDRHHSGAWSALGQAPSGDIILEPWLSELIICGSNDVMRRWAGQGRMEKLPDTAPRNVIAATAHQGRLFCTSADRPLTVFYSGSNDLGTWVDQDEVGDLVESSFDIPDADGRRITAMRGDFYGLLIIWTETSTWAFETAGSPAFDSRLRQISANIGCVGPRAQDAVGRDIIFLNKDGVYTLSTVQEYGDVTSTSLSAKLRGLWVHNNTIDQRKVVTNRNACVVHAPADNKTYVSVQRTGNADVSSIYVFNHDVGQWHGPYEFDSTLVEASGGGMRCIDYVQLGSQARQFLFAASSLGDVSYLSSDRKADFAAPDIDDNGYPIEFKLRSARLDGRSISPALIRRMKRWRGMWLYILPRGGDSVTVTWNVDGEATESSQTVSLNPYREPLLDTTFSLGNSALGDPERIGVIWIPLDCRGRWLEFEITIDDDTEADSKDIALVGFEIDAAVGDEEKDS